MKVNDWVIPVGSKKIVQIEAIESHEGLELAYTSDRSAYPINRLETIHTVYERITNKSNLQ